MTPEELRTLLDNIEREVDSVAAWVQAGAPSLAGQIAIGRAIAKQIPALAEFVDNLIQGRPPTDAEKAELTAKLAVLNDPNLP